MILPEKNECLSPHVFRFFPVCPKTLYSLDSGLKGISMVLLTNFKTLISPDRVVCLSKKFNIFIASTYFTL